MAKPYSYDLRYKVIAAIEQDGMKRCEASTVFQISRNTINRWFQQKAATGDLQSKRHPHPGHSHKITDWKAFQQFVEAHPELTQAKLAALWEGAISDRTISRALQKIGFTRKKKTYGYRERDVLKRATFEAQLATVDPFDLVYADEAGMDHRDQYGYGYSPKGYLPPYSPDFNKTERCWSWLKSRIPKQLDNFDTLREAMEHVLHLAS